MQISTDILYDIIPTQNGNIGTITLNRPKALNALSLAMIRSLDARLVQWAADPAIKIVTIQSSHEKAFCAGGDLKEIVHHKQKTNTTFSEIFWHEYRANYHIFHFPKPFVALLDGITMGGGVGISIHGSYRVATENFSFAMPETKIGFYPDIGASYFLPRLPGKIGIYLGLTGARINAADAMYLGLIDYYVLSDNLNLVKDELANSNLQPQMIDSILKKYASDPGPAPIKQYQAIIDECFHFNSVEAIIQALEKTSDPWALTVVDQLKSLSPTSLKVTLEQLHRGLTLNFDDCLQMEYCITNHFLNSKDVYEGIRAVVIDKDHQPKWQPATLAEVTQSHIDTYFVSLTDNDKLEFD